MKHVITMQLAGPESARSCSSVACPLIGQTAWHGRPCSASSNRPIPSSGTVVACASTLTVRKLVILRTRPRLAALPRWIPASGPIVMSGRSVSVLSLPVEPRLRAVLLICSHGGTYPSTVDPGSNPGGVAPTRLRVVVLTCSHGGTYRSTVDPGSNPGGATSGGPLPLLCPLPRQPCGPIAGSLGDVSYCKK
jgi:hypothetical protein